MADHDSLPSSSLPHLEGLQTELQRLKDLYGQDPTQHSPYVKALVEEAMVLERIKLERRYGVGLELA